MSAPAKTAGFPSPNHISELVWDSESDEEGALSDSNSEDEGHFEPGVSHLQTNCPTSSGQVSSTSFSSSAPDDGSFSEWLMSTGPYTFHFTVDMVLWPSEDCSMCPLHRAPGRRKKMKRHI